MEGIEKANRKKRKGHLVLWVFVISILIIIAIIVFKIGKRQSEKIPFEELKSTAVAIAVEYMEEKYGDAVTYTDMHEGRTSIILGERNWTVSFVDEDGQTYDVMVRYDSDNNCMYVEWDHYYSYYIEERMTEWMESLLKETDLSEYILEYVTHQFTAEWSAEYNAEQILQELKNKKNGYIFFRIRIPEREREIYDNGKLSDDLNELLKDTEGIMIELLIYPDDVFDHYQEDPDNNNSKDIERVEIWNNL